MRAIGTRSKKYWNMALERGVIEWYLNVECGVTSRATIDKGLSNKVCHVEVLVGRAQTSYSA